MNNIKTRAQHGSSVFKIPFDNDNAIGFPSKPNANICFLCLESNFAGIMLSPSKVIAFNPDATITPLLSKTEYIAYELLWLEWYNSDMFRLYENVVVKGWDSAALVNKAG